MATQPQITEEVKNQPEVDQETGKFIHTYQPRDAEGQFIGKPYRFLYTDHMDLVRQIEQAKESADRTIHEIKTGKRKLVGEAAVKNPDYVPAPDVPEDKKARDDWRRVAEQELGAPLDDVRDRLKRQRQMEEGFAAYNWALNKQADGYYPCPENGKKIAAWLKEKDYALTPANYDLAFEELRDSLVKAPKEPEAPADSTQQPAAQPTQAARPQSTGIIPGQFAGTRQPNRTEQQPLTRERFRQIDKMSRDEWNRLRRTNVKEADAFLQMKSPAQPQQ
jgi:vacuolar-type H+-ATPase subunit H